MACDSGKNPILPEDLLIEIFLRSSLESLLRVKCVCKHWYGLIKDHSFAYKHLQYRKNRKMHRLLLQTEKTHKGTSIYSYAVLNDKTQTSTPLQNLYMTRHSITMGGPVNGLYCLYNNHDRVVLWNPALKDFKLLPLPPPHSLPHRTLASSGHTGFGIDPLTNDYKVVLIRYFSDSSNQMQNPAVTLYNLTTNTWKPLDLGNFPIHQQPTKYLSSLFLNGTCHWCLSCGDVLAFDLGNEAFRVIPGPDHSQFDYQGNDFRNLGVYDERVVVWHRNKSLVYIWVMLEEGVWIKQISIGPLPGLVCPFQFWNNEGPLLLYKDSDPSHFDSVTQQIVLYDVKSQEMRKVGSGDINNGSRTLVYYESLVSFDGRTTCNKYKVSNFLDGKPPDVGRGSHRSTQPGHGRWLARIHDYE